MWQYQNTDELYHYGRLGMKWGYHIFGDKYKYKSREQKNVVKQLKKLSKIGVNKKNNSDYSKLKNKLKRLKKRDNKELASYKKEVAKKRVQKITERKVKQEKTKQEETKIKKSGTKGLTDNELKKQNERLRLENEYFRLRSEYDRHKAEVGKNKATQIMNKIGRKVLEPAVTEASKNVLQDLLTNLGKTTNVEINKKYRDVLKKNR